MCELPSVRLMAPADGAGLDEMGPPPRVRHGPRCRWACSQDGRSSPPSARRFTAATGSWARRIVGGRLAARLRLRRSRGGGAGRPRRAAGLIDVSTLGKLIVRGPDAGELLDRLYPNRMSTLKPGRIRYGVCNSDAGRIIDDGTVCRLDDDTFYVTTTSSGAGAVEEWFSWWLADWGSTCISPTSPRALAAVNLAGPEAREILGGVTEMDCSNEAFTYLDAQAGAGRRRALPDAADRLRRRARLRDPLPGGARGTPLGRSDCRPATSRRYARSDSSRSGSCACRRCTSSSDRTPTQSRPPSAAAMPWIVKLDKERGLHRPLGARARRGATRPRPRWSGSRCATGSVPTEGAVVLDGGRPAGQVTSARCSPRARAA